MKRINKIYKKNPVYPVNPIKKLKKSNYTDLTSNTYAMKRGQMEPKPKAQRISSSGTPHKKRPDRLL